MVSERLDLPQPLLILHEITTIIDNIIRKSVGPWASLKLIIDGNGQILTTADGATIMKYVSNTIETNISNRYIYYLLRDLAEKQDFCCGDGTSSVLLLVGCLCKSVLQFAAENEESLSLQDIMLMLEHTENSICTLIHEKVSFKMTFPQCIYPTLQAIQTKSVPPKEQLWLALVAHFTIKYLSEGYFLDDDSIYQPSRQSLLKQIMFETEPMHGKTISCSPQTLMFQSRHINDAISFDENTKFPLCICFSCPLSHIQDKSQHVIDHEKNQDANLLIQQFQSLLDQLHDDYILKYVFCQWSVDSRLMAWLTDHRILVVSHLDASTIQKISFITGAHICPFLEFANVKDHIGVLRHVSIVYQDDGAHQFQLEGITCDSLVNDHVYAERCRPRIIRFVLFKIHALHPSLVKEMERTMEDALNSSLNTILMDDGHVVWGAGFTEILLLNHLEQHFSDHHLSSIVLNAFTDFVRTLCVNAGHASPGHSIEFLRHQALLNAPHGVTLTSCSPLHIPQLELQPNILHRLQALFPLQVPLIEHLDLPHKRPFSVLESRLVKLTQIRLAFQFVSQLLSITHCEFQSL